MNAGQLAALIAAGFFAVLVCVAVFVLLRLAGLMSAVTGLVTRYSQRTDKLIEDAQAAVDRTNEQLARTDSITAGMDEVTSNMAELSGHLAAMAGLARTISNAVAAPLTGASAFVYGIRRAVLVRRSLEVVAPEQAALTGPVVTRRRKNSAGRAAGRSG
jgi:hypothetical protein